MEDTLTKSAILVLEDGTKFYGKSIGVIGIVVGEVVFNTTMTGYQEILTDCSYYNQIVTLTYPHIGNVGMSSMAEESKKIYAKGLIIRDLSIISSNFRSEINLEKYLKNQNIVAISDIDTRKLTRLLREKGSQNGCIITGSIIDTKIASLALKKAQKFLGLKGVDLVKEVSTINTYTWTKGSVTINDDNVIPKKRKKKSDFPYHVVVYDYGVKYNILRMLVDRGCFLTVVPAQISAQDVMKLKPDGILLSNGPGDPEPCTYAISNIKFFLNIDIPIFGICLGHQLLALASGAKTIKMKLGHHGGNHPVKDLLNNKVMITSQNHNFTIDPNSIPQNLYITHISLFDQTIQGICRVDKPAFSFQGHPEGSPGPHDAMHLFDSFISLINNYRSKIKYN